MAKLSIDNIRDRFLSDWPGWSDAMVKLDQAIDLLCDVSERDGLVMVCGNGGSASDSAHIVGELGKTFCVPRCSSHAEVDTPNDPWTDVDDELVGRLQCGIRAISLSCSNALMTAIANDNGQDLVFAQQVWSLARQGDVVIGLSTSGNSDNVVKALKVAQWRGGQTIAFTGQNPCAMDAFADVLIKAPSVETYRIQEYHLGFYHAMCAMVETKLFG